MPDCEPGDAGAAPAHPPMCRTSQVVRPTSAKRVWVGANPMCDSIMEGQADWRRQRGANASSRMPCGFNSHPFRHYAMLNNRKGVIINDRCVGIERKLRAIADRLGTASNGHAPSAEGRARRGGDTDATSAGHDIRGAIGGPPGSVCRHSANAPVAMLTPRCAGP